MGGGMRCQLPGHEPCCTSWPLGHSLVPGHVGSWERESCPRLDTFCNAMVRVRPWAAVRQKGWTPFAIIFHHFLESYPGAAHTSLREKQAPALYLRFVVDVSPLRLPIHFSLHKDGPVILQESLQWIHCPVTGDEDPYVDWIRLKCQMLTGVLTFPSGEAGSWGFLMFVL